MHKLRTGLGNLDKTKVNAIVAKVERKHGLSLQKLAGRQKSMERVKARDELVFLLRRHTSLTLNEVGQMLGGRTPATISSCWERYFERSN